MENRPLDSLLGKVQVGDSLAISQFMELYSSEVVSTAHGIQLSNIGDLSFSDLVQEAWLRILSRISSFTSPDGEDEADKALRRWIQVTARNIMLDLLKSRRPQVNAVTDVQTSQSSWIRGIDNQESVSAAIQTLADDEQVFVQKCFFDELPLTVVADQLGLTYDQARYRLGSILSKLETKLKPDHR